RMRRGPSLPRNIDVLVMANTPMVETGCRTAFSAANPWRCAGLQSLAEQRSSRAIPDPCTVTTARSLEESRHIRRDPGLICRAARQDRLNCWGAYSQRRTDAL